MFKHGHATRVKGKACTPEYQAWIDMRRRCDNEIHPAFVFYGARGITVCDRWADFENFYKDMGDRPNGMSLDRIDVNGIYEPSNCRWATKVEQSRNRRNARVIEYQGEAKCLSEWAELLGFTYHLLKDRLSRGWSIEKAFCTPVRS